MARDTMPPKAYHVRAGEGGWVVSDDRTARPLGRFEDREDAIAVAHDAVEAEGFAQLIVHNSDGSVASQWPSDETIALSEVEVFYAGELAVDAAEADDEAYIHPGSKIDRLRDDGDDAEQGGIE